MKYHESRHKNGEPYNQKYLTRPRSFIRGTTVDLNLNLLILRDGLERNKSTLMSNQQVTRSFKNGIRFEDIWSILLLY